MISRGILSNYAPIIDLSISHYSLCSLLVEQTKSFLTHIFDIILLIFPIEPFSNSIQSFIDPNISYRCIIMHFFQFSFVLSRGSRSYIAVLVLSVNSEDFLSNPSQPLVNPTDPTVSWKFNYIVKFSTIGICPTYFLPGMLPKSLSDSWFI